MRVMQVNGFAPTSQNRMTFKRNEKPVRELLQEALLLFLEEHEAMQRALASSTTSVTETTPRFSEKLVATFKTLAEKAAAALREDPSAPTDVKALVTDPSAPTNVKALMTADRFFSINTSVSTKPTDEALSLYTQSAIRVEETKRARPDLATMFSQEAK